MEQRTYAGDVFQKIAGLSFIVGAILLVVFGLLHPEEDLEDLSDTIQSFADSNGGLMEIDHTPELHHSVMPQNHTQERATLDPDH